MVQIWSWFNDCDLSRDFAYREIRIPIALFLWHFQHAILETLKWCPSSDVTRGLTRVEYCHVSLWFVTYMCLKCWIILTLVITWLCHVFLADVVCWRESDRRSRSHLDLMAVIKSQYRISRFRDSCGYYSLTSSTLDPRNFKMYWDQWSRSYLDSMVAIKSWFHNSCCIVSFPSSCCDSWNFDMELDQWSRSDLDSMTAIKS